MLNVQQALSIPPLTRSRVVAGAGGLHRIIKNITIMEVPDIVQWLKGSDFVLTSFFCIKDDPDAQVRLVQDMARFGCAALAIKTDRYVKTLPPEMIAAADSLSFPLLEIPREVSYIDIINPLMEGLLDHAAGVLRQADIAFRWLQQVLLSNQGLEAALATLQRMIKYDLTLECPELGLILTTSEDSNPLRPLSKEAIRKLSNAYHPLFLQRNRKESEVPSLVIPITDPSSVHAFLTVENYQQKQGLSPTIQAILDHTIPLIGMEIMRLHSRSVLEHQQINSFVEELITQDFKSDKAMLERARYLGLNLTHPCLLLVFNVDEFSSPNKQNPAEKEAQLLKAQLQRDLTHQLKQNSPAPFIVGLRGDSLVVVTTWPPEQGKEEIPSSAYKLAQNILLYLKWSFPSLQFTGGIGLPQQSVRKVGLSFSQAWKAIVLGSQVYGSGRVYCYDRLGVYRLLCSHSDIEELIALRDEILGPLADYDKKQRANLLETLAAYFSHNEDINTTAEALFVHPNTVRYRLERAAKLLARDLNLAEDRFQLYLALKITSLYPFAGAEKNNNKI